MQNLLWRARNNKIVGGNITYLHGVNKDEMNFFLVGMGGPEPFIEWAAARKEMKLGPLTDEEKALAESFCKDVEGEDYEPYCKLLSQLMFNAPCIRLSEEQTKAVAELSEPDCIYWFTSDDEREIQRHNSLYQQESAPETILSELFERYTVIYEYIGAVGYVF